MSDVCPLPGELVARELAKTATQYREAPKMRAYFTAVLGQIEEVARAACEIPDYFDLNSAVGEQLTFIGKRMGFGRCHCACDTRPVFGFKCPDTVQPYPTAGFCEPGIWAGCGGVSDLCIEDDEVYRAHLKARRYQILGLYDLESLSAALKLVWGGAAWIPRARGGQVVVAPGRNLSQSELQRLPVTLRILPFAPGVRLAVHYGTARIAGFGAGWTGFCDSVPDQPVFGFPCDDSVERRPQRGFCADDAVWTACASPIVSAGHWLCPVEIDPYACS